MKKTPEKQCHKCTVIKQTVQQFNITVFNLFSSSNFNKHLHDMSVLYSGILATVFRPYQKAYYYINITYHTANYAVNHVCTVQITFLCHTQVSQNNYKLMPHKVLDHNIKNTQCSSDESHAQWVAMDHFACKS